MADNVIRFPDRGKSGIAAIDQRPEANDTITFTRDSLPPPATDASAMPRHTSTVDQTPWTELVTRDFDGRG